MWKTVNLKMVKFFQTELIGNLPFDNSREFCSLFFVPLFPNWNQISFPRTDLKDIIWVIRRIFFPKVLSMLLCTIENLVSNICILLTARCKWWSGTSWGSCREDSVLYTQWCSQSESTPFCQCGGCTYWIYNLLSGRFIHSNSQKWPIYVGVCSSPHL